MMEGGKNADDPMSYAAPEANAYEFQSGGIVGLLKKLRDELKEDDNEFPVIRNGGIIF